MDRNTLQKYFQKPQATPIILFLVCFVAYGLYLPWMGFYWDDWPWIWRFHVYGSQAIREIDSAFRPLAGVVLWMGSQLVGENAFGWQLLNFIIRWSGGVALWWSLRQVWPKRNQTLTWIAILFVLYPGFSQQFVSINSSRHLFPLITFFLSFGFTAKAIADRPHYWALTAAAVGLSVVTMLTTEYYYGLEFVRVALLWVLVQTKGQTLRTLTGSTLKAWGPYLVPLVAVFNWRYLTSPRVNYEVVLVDQFNASPIQTISLIISSAMRDFFEAGLGAWGKLVEFPFPAMFGPRKTMLYWGIAGIGTLGIYFFASQSLSDAKNRRWNLQIMTIGAAALLISGMPFWATGLAVKLSFPNDRLTLPMMMGASFFVVGLLDLIKPRILNNLAFALITGLALGTHFQNAVSYQRDWETQTAFFQQLSWRIPGLSPGTTLLSPELPILYSTDNSLTAPLNWIYGPNQPSAEMRYSLLFIDLRLGTKVPSFEADVPIEIEAGQHSFTGSTSQAILLYYNPPACLRVLHPIYDKHLPGTPDLLDKALPISNMDPIVANPDSPATLPAHIYGRLPPPGEQWCYYFQKADLARQIKDWEQVASLGNIAFELDDSPNHASERLPFIEGYAHVRKWDAAIDLTLEAIEINKFMGPMLCDTWERILQDIPVSELPAAAIGKVEEQLACGLIP